MYVSSVCGLQRKRKRIENVQNKTKNLYFGNITKVTKKRVGARVGK